MYKIAAAQQWTTALWYRALRCSRAAPASAQAGEVASARQRDPPCTPV
jgi:hypothetical protein